MYVLNILPTRGWRFCCTQLCPTRKKWYHCMLWTVSLKRKMVLLHILIFSHPRKMLLLHVLTFSLSGGFCCICNCLPNRERWYCCTYWTFSLPERDGIATIAIYSPFRREMGLLHVLNISLPEGDSVLLQVLHILFLHEWDGIAACPIVSPYLRAMVWLHVLNILPEMVLLLVPATCGREIY